LAGVIRRRRETMRTTYEGNVWKSVETEVDPSVKNEIRRWHVYRDGTFLGTKHTVARYTDEGIRSGSITDEVIATIDG
jgi:hypothetical protein